MATATSRNNNKAIRRPRCKHCNKQFRTTSTVKRYCSALCQKEATKLKRRVSYTYRATSSAFFYHLAHEAERAGTLEIFTGHTAESLVDLHIVYKLWLKANQYGDIKSTDPRAFEISHIAPANGTSLGLFHASNLVVAPKAMNRAHGTKNFGYGLSIPRSQLDPRYAVEKGCNRKSLINRIVKFIGEDVVCEAVKVAKIQATQRHRTLAWLYDHLDPANPEHSKFLALIDGMTAKALSEVRAQVEGKQASGFRVKTETYSPLRVLMHELDRHTAIRPDLALIKEAVLERAPDYLVYHVRFDLIAPTELQALFDVLHGRDVAEVQQVFTPQAPATVLKTFHKLCPSRGTDGPITALSS
ncbi:hypothetical protein ABQX22_00520 [Xanthomonas sp. WHRI 1810A]|uniref:hypothetical protein n=1 Tax=Xanthomonas sp. WHRI 1810A TaxID=3161565 RepID=UPI0032E8BCEC